MKNYICWLTFKDKNGTDQNCHMSYMAEHFCFKEAYDECTKNMLNKKEKFGELDESTVFITNYSVLEEEDVLYSKLYLDKIKLKEL